MRYICFKNKRRFKKLKEYKDLKLVLQGKSSNPAVESMLFCKANKKMLIIYYIECAHINKI